MKAQKCLIVVLVAIALTCWVEKTTAQTSTPALTEQQLKDLVTRIDKDATQFAKTANNALDKSGYDGTTREDELNGHLKNFRSSAEKLKGSYKDSLAVRGYAEEVLRYGVAIDGFLKRNPLDGVEADWVILHGGLEQLASAYGVSLSDTRFAATGAKVGAADVKNLVKHINEGANQYRKTLDSALDNSRLDGTSAEDEINRYVKDFRDCADRLENHYKEETAAQDAAEVIRHAKLIDGFMRKYPLTREAQNDWSTVRTDIGRLANLYSVYLQWQ